MGRPGRDVADPDLTAAGKIAFPAPAGRDVSGSGRELCWRA
ncbi:hypothetical protein ACFOY4_32635 [Actinomadura syzygii]|nr:hypothetical protein [Actinomadura syzygii]